jgi:hypothetical protein
MQHQSQVKQRDLLGSGAFGLHTCTIRYSHLHLHSIGQYDSGPPAISRAQLQGPQDLADFLWELPRPKALILQLLRSFQESLLIMAGGESRRRGDANNP